MKNIVLVILNILLAFMPSMVAASPLPKGRCHMMDPDSGPCSIVINGTKYTVYINGTIAYKGPEGETRFIRTRLPEFFYVEAVQSYHFNEDIIFLLEITDDDAGSTIVIKCSPSDPTAYWTVELGAFNPSPPLVEADSVYLGGIGTVAKIDLKTGRIDWRHSGLYESDTMAFNSFLKPVRRDKVIVFPEDKVSSAEYPGVREIWVNDDSGEIIRK